MNETDDQFTTRITEALRHGTESAPVPADLAASARTLRSTRVRRRLAATATAGVLIVAAGVAFAVPHGGESSNPSPAGPTTVTRFDGTDWIPEGWRSESYRDVELAVPATWPYGAMYSHGCSEDPEAPVFERPGGISDLVGCIGPSGNGVQFTDPKVDVADPDNYVPGAVVRTKVIGDVMVLAVLPDADLADRVIGTVHRINGTDANGCAPTVSVPDLRHASVVPDSAGPISVCRYDLFPTVALAQSESLAGRDAAALREALATAPRGSGPDSGPDHCIDSPETAVVLFGTQGGPLAWVHYSGCDGHGVDAGSGSRELTGGVLTWTFSPGYSGEVPNVDFKFRTFTTS